MEDRSRCGYEVLMELPLLKKIKRGRQRSLGSVAGGDGSSSSDDDDEDDDDGKRAKRDDVGNARGAVVIVNKDELQRVLLGKLFLCALTVEKLAGMHLTTRDLEDLQGTIPFTHPGFFPSNDAKTSHDDGGDSDSKRTLKATSPSISSVATGASEYSANSPSRTSQGPSNWHLDKRRLETDLKVIKSRKNGEDSPRSTPPKANVSNSLGVKRGWTSDSAEDDVRDAATQQLSGKKLSPASTVTSVDSPLMNQKVVSLSFERSHSPGSLTSSSTSPTSMMSHHSSGGLHMDRKSSVTLLKFGVPTASPVQHQVGTTDKPFTLNDEEEDSSEPIIHQLKKSHSSHREEDAPPISKEKTPKTEQSQPIRRKKSMSLLERHSAEYLAKEVKREALLELVGFIKDDWLDYVVDRDLCVRACLEMIKRNLFRCPAPPPTGGRDTSRLDPDDDTPLLDPRWPHISVVYEMLLRLLSTQSLAKSHLDVEFCSRIIHLFRTEDPRERDYLKNVLHRVYGLYPSLRPTIRRELQVAFEVVVNERQRHVGVLELLEVVGSIVSGFSVPLKKEHVEFFRAALIPLHRADSITLFHSQLCYCVSQMIEKHSACMKDAVEALRRYFPRHSASKQLLFLNELDELMEVFLHGEAGKLVGRRLHGPRNSASSSGGGDDGSSGGASLSKQDLNDVLGSVAAIVEECLLSEHFQVVERALFLWNSDHLADRFFKSSMPYMRGIFSAVERDRTNHWNPTVRALADEVASLYREDEYYEEATSPVAHDAMGDWRKRKTYTDRQRMWATITALAESRGDDHKA